MKKKITYYATENRVSDYIERKLDLFDSHEDFLNEVKETILSLEEDVDVNQINFFNKVKEKLEHFVV
jgi:hypothetical protein